MKHQPTELELHAAQTALLHVLLFQPDASFSELNAAGLSSDHFNFHLQRLLEAGLIAKKENGRYALTTAGKEFANRYDTDNRVIERQAKVCVLLLVTKVEDGVTKYLVQQRLKQPYYGFYGKPTGKIKWGEEVLVAAARELQEETNLSVDLSLTAIEHKVDSSPEGRLLEDKYFFIVEGRNPQGEFRESFDGGRNFWMTEEEMDALTETFSKLSTIYTKLGNQEVGFREWQYTAEKY